MKSEIRLNHETGLFRLICDGKTIARAEEVALFRQGKQKFFVGASFDPETNQRLVLGSMPATF